MSQPTVTPRPTSQRAAVLVVIVSGALLAGYLAVWLGVDRLHIGRADFTSAYVGATLLRQGHRADLYDDSLQRSLHSQLIAPDSEGNLPFVNPPTAAALALPLTFLDLETAWRVMGALQLLCLAAALWIAVRASGIGGWSRGALAAAGLAGLPALPLLLLGQWDGLLALGLAGAWLLLQRKRDLAGGLLLAVTAGLAKPHLFLGLAVFLLAWRRPRLLLGALGGTVGLGLVDLALVGPDGLHGLLTADSHDSSLWPLASLLGADGLTGSWLGDGSAAVIAGWVLAAVALAGCAVLGDAQRRAGPLEPRLAAVIALSLLASPHLLAHDLVLLAPAFLWACAAGGRSARVAAALWVAVSVALALDLGSSATGPPGRLVPVVLIAAGVLGIRLTPFWPAHRQAAAR